MANVFRADQIGSLVKPPALLAAQALHSAGSLDDQGLFAAQDSAIRDVLQMLPKTGITVLGDGELRRPQSEALYASAIAGIRYRESREQHRPDSQSWRSPYCVAAELRQERRLTVAETRFLQAQTKLPYKISLLAPSALALRLFEPGLTDRHYPTLGALAAAFAEIVLAEIHALAGEGVRYIQLDAPAYGWLYDVSSRSQVKLPVPDGAFEALLALDVAMLGRVSKTAATALGLRIGRSPAAEVAADTYERMLEKVLGVAPVDRFLLEYAAPQAHDFQSLRALPAGKIAVLGLVNSDTPPQEVDDLLVRFDQAVACTQEEQLAISPRHGFTNLPGRTTEELLELQRRSLERTGEVVQRIWGLEL